jgi:hypothetical protein
MHKERWATVNMEYAVLDGDDPNFQDYAVKIPRNEKALIQEVGKLIEEGNRLYKQDVTELPNIHFDRHLYQPLLVERGDKIRSEPPGLNASEQQFVADLRDYCRQEKVKALAETEVFLLRNLSRGKGIGFFETRGFYPDFILWIKRGTTQRIVFIEPHGMLHAGSYQHDDKARLHDALPALAKEMAKRKELTGIALDSYIVSATPFEHLRRKYDDGTWDKARFTAAHILFPERSGEFDYVRLLFQELKGSA